MRLTITPPPWARKLVSDRTDMLHDPQPLGSAPVELELPDDAYFEYAFLDADGAMLPDPNNDRRADNPWFPHASAVVGPNYRPDALASPAASLETGESDRLRRISTALGGQARNAVIYTPAGMATAELPLVIVQDGQAFRRVATILRQVAPRVVIDFDIACGVGLRGTQDPQAPLTMLYPGDDVVDVIGCDTYDDGGMKVDRGAAFLGKNDKGPGLSDVLAFARAHKKPMSIPEWGLDARHAQGDNGPYIIAMRDFLEANATHILFENYFNEPGTAIRSSIWQDVQNPVSSQAYRLRWQNPSRLTIATSAGK